MINFEPFVLFWDIDQSNWVQVNRQFHGSARLVITRRGRSNGF